MLGSFRLVQCTCHKICNTRTFNGNGNHIILVWWVKLKYVACFYLKFMGLARPVSCVQLGLGEKFLNMPIYNYLEVFCTYSLFPEIRENYFIVVFNKQHLMHAYMCMHNSPACRERQHSPTLCE